MQRSFLVPTIFTIFTFCLLVTLGTWQILRLIEKNEHIASVQKAMKSSPVTLASVDLDKPDILYQRVRMSGRFLHEQEVHLFTGARVPKGKPGYNILTPFERSEGGVVLVDRGWTLTGSKSPQHRKDSIVLGAVTIEGIVMSEEKPGYFTPRNQLEKNLWFWLDTEALREFTGFDLPQSYIRQVSPNRFKSIIAGEAEIIVRNDHLQYAITWYILAIVSLVIYVLLRKQQNQ
jgi:surfeit locus 1 family protein